MHCIVPLQPVWTLQTNTTRKGNRAHSPPSTAALSWLLRLPDCQLPRERSAFISLVAGGTEADGWSAGRAGFTSIRCNVNPDQGLFLFIKSPELTTEKMKGLVIIHYVGPIHLLMDWFSSPCPACRQVSPNTLICFFYSPPFIFLGALSMVAPFLPHAFQRCRFRSIKRFQLTLTNSRKSGLLL